MEVADTNGYPSRSAGWPAEPYLIQLGGDIDLANAQPLSDALCSALSRRQRPLVVDLAEVTFIDSSAISMMLAVHEHARALDLSVAWSNPQRQARQALHITGVDRVLDLDDRTTHEV
jgi:anti-anti-sigma factor